MKVVDLLLSFATVPHALRSDNRSLEFGQNGSRCQICRFRCRPFMFSFAVSALARANFAFLLVLGMLVAVCDIM